MTTLNIVVVHDDSRIREYVSRQALSLSPPHRVFSHDGNSFYQASEWKYVCDRGEQDALKATAFDLAIAHAGNRAEAKALKPKRLVLFGGHGEAGDPRAKECEYIYQDIYGKVTRKEMLEIFGPLVDWCQGGERPWFLDPPDAGPKYPISLAQLCQGYLAQYALKSQTDGGAVDISGCADVDTALKAMGWVDEDGSKPEIVKELEHQRSTKSVDESESERDEAKSDKSSKSNSVLDFWRSPFEGKSLRQGLEEECRSLRKNVQNKIQNGTLEWPDNATLPSRTAKLVEAIEKAVEAEKKANEMKLSVAESKNNPLFEQDFICLVAKAYLELNKLLEAA
jgi:hypothetical protein